MALENLKSVFDNIIIPDYDTEIGGIHGGTTAETPSRPPHPSSHIAGMESTFGNIGVNLSQHGGRHGGLSELTPSLPPHSEVHSLFDIGVGIYGSPQYAGVSSDSGIPFPSLYDPNVGGIHGGLSTETPSQPPHLENHSIFDNLKPRLGFGSGVMNFELFGPSAFENMISEDLSPIWNFASNVGSFGSGVELGGAPVSFYSPVTVASNQQTYTVNSPYGFNTQVTGHIVFPRTPRVDENTLPVDFLTKGYSYTGMNNYSLDIPNEIAGFTKNFSLSEFLNDDGTVIASGLASKTYSDAKDVTSTTYSIVQARIVDFLTSPISGFTKNFNNTGWAIDKKWGISNFLVNSDTGGTVIDSQFSSLADIRISQKSFSLDGITRDYDTYGISPDGYDWRTAHGTPTSPYQGQILNINPYQGSILDTKGDVNFSNVAEVDVTEGYMGAEIKTKVTNFLTSEYTPFGGDGLVTISGFDANFDTPAPYGEKGPSKLVADINSTPITSRYLDSAKEVPEGAGTGINLQASSWWTGGDTAVKALVIPSQFIYTKQGIEIGLTQAANTRTVSINANKLSATTLAETKGWEALYNADHTAKDNVGYHYPNVSRKSLDLRYQGSGVSSYHTLRSLWWKEPYVITDIEDRQVGITGRSFPIERALTDVVRLGKYLTSPSGLLFIGKQNLLGWVAGDSSIEIGGLKLPTPQKFSQTYNPRSTLAAAGGRLLGQGVPNVLVRRDFPSKVKPGPSDALHDTYTDYLNGALYKIDSNNLEVDAVNNVNQYTTGIFGTSWVDKTGDKFTREPIAEEDDLSMELEDFETESMGMPLYFKDLRDNKYIIFRAFVEGIDETLSPSWATENYIGRSEPVYIYENAERSISFDLKLFAQTKDELKYIYKKLNRLTSLCYPEYKKDANLASKTRMKPPLVKFRLGELFGSEKNEMLGFIDSLTYTFDDNSPWETKRGKRVPKYISASITFQVIHMEVPSLDFARSKRFGLEDKEDNIYQFYGINRPPVNAFEALAGQVGGVGVE